MAQHNNTEQNDLVGGTRESGDLDPHESLDLAETPVKISIGSKFTRWLLILLIFASGFGSGYIFGEGNILQGDKALSYEDLMDQINPPEGYLLSVSYNEIGPKLIQAGVIDQDKFIEVFELAGKPLNNSQKRILIQGSDEKIVIDHDSAYFLLNFFWALGLANDNPILTEGPMFQYGGSDGVGRFASTGGWTLSINPVQDIYASMTLIPLTKEQQIRLEKVAKKVYRPCCNNPTYFPDCNHGMAMLGLLTLLAGNDASEKDLFESAKYVNAFWYPQQYLEIALYLNSVDGQTFSDLDSEVVVSKEFSSGSGFAQTHQYLVANGLLEQTPGEGSSCGV